MISWLTVIKSGQGYIWMAHKTPGTDTWDLAVRSKNLWEELAADVEREGYDPGEVLGWKKTGTFQNKRTLLILFLYSSVWANGYDIFILIC
jgi:hypothetical protein